MPLGRGTREAADRKVVIDSSKNHIEKTLKLTSEVIEVVGGGMIDQHPNFYSNEL
jgi:fructose-1,6-bisphosphatase/sedoheptulose 1,7-bisphosphatase-like protein